MHTPAQSASHSFHDTLILFKVSRLGKIVHFVANKLKSVKKTPVRRRDRSLADIAHLEGLPYTRLESLYENLLHELSNMVTIHGTDAWNEVTIDDNNEVWITDTLIQRSDPTAAPITTADIAAMVARRMVRSMEGPLA